jgi:hypothetical protein
MTPDTDEPVYPWSSDGVEIKFSFSGAAADSVLDSFDLEESAAERMTIHFFDALAQNHDEPRLRLLDGGLVLRVRLLEDGSGNTTLKLRPANGDRLIGPWQAGTDHDGDYRVEYDWGVQRVLAASLDDGVAADAVGPVLGRGLRSRREAFSKEQRALLRQCGPDLADPFDRLDDAGPIRARRWRDLDVDGLTGNSALRAERWEYGDGRAFVELSVRVKKTAKAEERRHQLQDVLRQRSLVPDQGGTKTEAVLRDLLSR